jgi:hypothetical protein
VVYSRQTAVSGTRHRYTMGPQWDMAPNTCAYCGVYGCMTEDHVIPVSGMSQLLYIKNLVSWVVPACYECNMGLNNKTPYVIVMHNSRGAELFIDIKCVRSFHTVLKVKP